MRWLWVSCLAVACSGTTPPNATPPPQINLITVFFPEDNNLVRGHGEVGAMPQGIPYLEVNAHPTSTTDHFPVNPDGSFDFDIIAQSGDILELSGTQDMSGTGKGDVTYVRVPVGVGSHEPYICCFPMGQTKGTCQAHSAMVKNQPCPDRGLPGATDCASDGDCFADNGVNLPIVVAGIQVGSPDKDGKIQIVGSGQIPHALMRLQNRGKKGVGGEDRGVRTGRVMNKDGAFVFNGIVARGEDELVFSIIDLNGNLSAELPVYVPNAAMEAIDVIGAYPYEPLYDGVVGKVAVRLRPRGIDGFGICPESTKDPLLCFNGGLTHDMVSIDLADFQCMGTQVMRPPPSATSPQLPSNRGTEGDPTTGPKAFVVIVDMSKAAGVTDGPSPLRFDAIERFISNLPSNSQVGIVSFGGAMVSMDFVKSSDPDFKGCNTSTGSMTSNNGIYIPRAYHREYDLSKAKNGSFKDATDVIERLRNTTPSGDSDVYSAIREATMMLSNSGNVTGTTQGVIVAVVAANITINPQTACVETAQVNSLVGANLNTGTPGFQTHIIGANLTEMGMKTEATNVGNLKSIASFSGSAPFGTYTGIRSIGALSDAMAGLNGAISGDYVLLYDMLIPRCAGKGTTLTLMVTANLSSQGTITTKQAIYKGPLDIAGATGGNP